MGWIKRLKGKKMKRMIWLILIALTVAVFFVGCRKNAEHDTDDIDGGVRINTSYDAPKKIESTKINTFYCEFSNLTMMNEDTFLKNRVYQLEAFLKEGIVQGSYKIYGGGEGQEETFVTEENFLEEIQKVVEEHNLVKHNGLSYMVSGLPDQFGAVLKVEYESGECIYASHNQDNFIPIEAMEALDLLFRKQFEEVDDKNAIPKTIDVTVSEQFSMENINERYVAIECPVLELGYETPDGNWTNIDGHTALEEALNMYNKEEWDFHVGSRSVLRNAAESLEGDNEAYRELYTYTDAYVTRNDTNVLSFYTFTRHYEGWIKELYDWETRNFDVKTGKLLSFEDVFNDLDEMAAIVAAEMKAAYPEQQFLDEVELLVHKGMQANESILFALSYDCVHIFSENQYLSYENIKGQHIVLNYSDYPEIVKEEYRTSAPKWMVKLDFDMEHPLIQNLQTQLDWEYMQDGYLICNGDQQYVYLRVPMGDVTLLTYIYKVTDNDIVFIGEVDGAMHDEANFNPECMKMYKNIDLDEMEIGEAIPFGVYHIGEEGYPISTEDVVN